MKWYMSGLKSLMGHYLELSRDEQEIITLELSRFIASACICIIRKPDISVGSAFHLLDISKRLFQKLATQDLIFERNKMIPLLVTTIILSIKIDEDNAVYIEDFRHPLRHAMKCCYYFPDKIKRLERHMLHYLDYRVAWLDPNDMINLIQIHCDKKSISILVGELEKNYFNYADLYTEKLVMFLCRENKPAEKSIKINKELLNEIIKFRFIEIQLEYLAKIIEIIDSSNYSSTLTSLRKILSDKSPVKKFINQEENIHIFWSTKKEELENKIKNELKYRYDFLEYNKIKLKAKEAHSTDIHIVGSHTV